MAEPLRRRYVSPQEFSQIFGVSQKNIYSLIARDLLPFIRVGRLIRINLNVFESRSEKLKDEA